MVSTALEETVVLSDKLLVEADILAAGAIGRVEAISGVEESTFSLFLRLLGGMLEAGKMNKAWEVE